MNALLLTMVLGAPAQRVESPPVPCPTPAPVVVATDAPTPSDLLIAATILDAPRDTPVPEFEHAQWLKVRGAIHAVARQREIMDEREERYLCAQKEDFVNDIDILRKRNVDLMDAPKLVDLNRFVDRGTANDLLRFNRAFKQEIEKRMVWEADRADIFEQVLKYNEKCYHAWDAFRDARCDFYYVSVRRVALKKFRDAIGETDYNLGKMPDYVPTWAFGSK